MISTNVTTVEYRPRHRCYFSFPNKLEQVVLLYVCVIAYLTYTGLLCFQINCKKSITQDKPEKEQRTTNMCLARFGRHYNYDITMTSAVTRLCIFVVKGMSLTLYGKIQKRLTVGHFYQFFFSKGREGPSDSNSANKISKFHVYQKL